MEINAEALEEFIAWRKEAKKPMTDRAIGMLKKKLANYSPEIQAMAIERAVIAGWTGVFPEKERPQVTANTTRGRTLQQDLNDRDWAR